MDAEYFGKVTRYLISNHMKGRPVRKEELSRMLGVTLRDMDEILSGLATFLQSLGLELASITKDEIVAAEKGKKFFLRKMPIKNTKRVKMMPTEDERRLFLVLSAVQLENNRLDESKFETIRGSQWFKNVNVQAIFNKYRMAGYLSCKKENERVIWLLGWRFYVEYGDCLDVVSYFNDLQKLDTTNKNGYTVLGSDQ